MGILAGFALYSLFVRLIEYRCGAERIEGWLAGLLVVQAVSWNPD
jgi:hypothetical protein